MIIIYYYQNNRETTREEGKDFFFFFGVRVFISDKEWNDTKTHLNTADTVIHK